VISKKVQVLNYAKKLATYQKPVIILGSCRETFIHGTEPIHMQEKAV